MFNLKMKALALSVIAVSATFVSPLGEAVAPKRDFKGFIREAQGTQAVLFMAKREGEVRLKLASVASVLQPCTLVDARCRELNAQIYREELEGQEMIARLSGKDAKAELYAPASPHALAVVSVDGKDLAVELVKQGKMVFCPNTVAPNQDAVLAAQDEARQAKRGVWKISQDFKTPPSCEANYRAL